MGLLDFLKGKKDKVKFYNPYTDEQSDFLDYILQQSQGNLPQAFKYLEGILGDEEGAYEDFEAPAMQQFEQEIIPSILERFSGMGARSSSALNQTLGQAGKELSTNLSAQRAGLKNNALQNLMNFAQMGMQSKKTPYVKKGSPGFLDMAAPAAGNFLANKYSSFLGL